MNTLIRRVEYFYTIVQDEPGEAYRVLAMLAEQGVNLLAFNGIPMGPTRTQLAIFPEDTAVLVHEINKTGMDLDGPHHAILVQGADALGVLAGIHERLSECSVNVYASAGVASSTGSYGYVLYIRPDEIERATEALEL